MLKYKKRKKKNNVCVNEMKVSRSRERSVRVEWMEMVVRGDL